MTAGGSAWLDHRAGQGGGQAPQGRGWWCPPVGWLLPPADRGRACRSRPERADRARMPGRPALVKLGSTADRRHVGTTGGRGRLPQPVHDPRHGHRCRGSTAERGCPGHRRPDRAAGIPHRKLLRHNRGPPDEPPRLCPCTGPRCPGRHRRCQASRPRSNALADAQEPALRRTPVACRHGRIP